jgi:hypothetical protein
MSLKWVGKWVPFLSVWGLSITAHPAAYADGLGFCGRGCERCPPAFLHRQEGPPCLKFRTRCPKPVCNPCELQHYGYFATCWHAWPFPPDYSHCPYPHNGSAGVMPGPMAGPNVRPEPSPAPEKGPMPSPEQTTPKNGKPPSVLPEVPKR